MATSAIAEPCGQRARGLVLELALEVAGVLGHPDDHVGDHRDGDEGDDRLEALLLALGELVVDDPQHDGDRDAQRDGQARRPSHIERSASGRPWRRRKAAMMPTMSEASRPSRRAITNVVEHGILRGLVG